MTNPIDRAAAWLQAWDGQGTHRTATAGDEAGADWLAAEAAALGVAPRFEAFDLDRLDPGGCYLEFAGTRVDAVPAFDAPATAEVEGRLGAEIAVAELTPRTVYSGEYRALRQQGGHRGAGHRLQRRRPRHGPPQRRAVPRALRRAGDPCVERGARRRAHGRLARCTGAARRRQPPHPHPGAATSSSPCPAATPPRPPLVVMTPRSSWWQSTAERGGGIVCWLETLRALLAAPPRRPVTLVATSGHELGHLGLDDFVARRPGCERGYLWVHYGANIGAAGGALSLMSSRAELAARAATEIAPDRIAPKTQVPSGETRDIHVAGGAYLTLVGTSPLFHLPQDRWPHSVDVPRIAQVAAGAARVVAALASGGVG